MPHSSEFRALINQARLGAERGTSEADSAPEVPWHKCLPPSVCPKATNLDQPLSETVSPACPDLVCLRRDLDNMTRCVFSELSALPDK